AESFVDPVLATRVNCEGTASVFEAARRVGVRRVVWASSISVWYGLAPFPHDREVSNDHPHCPDDVYGASKAFDEWLGKVYGHHFGLQNIGLRFAHGTGAGRTRGGGAWARELVDKPALGEPSVLEYGDELENWLSVEDQASAIVAACRARIEVPWAVYTVAGFDLKTRRQAAEYVRQLLPGAEIEVRPGRLDRPVRYDTTAMEQATGWRARHGMEETLLRMINRVRALHGLPLVG
ncbi:MAG TPA: NAD(P)-dependent oxidoreductase, partial [Bacillota bacterium]